MSKPLVHTPEGVRDIYGEEYLRKLLVEEKLHHTLRSFGYQDIQTPTFEFFDVFSREIGTTPSRELYKFLTRRVIPSYCGLILPLPWRAAPQNTLWMKSFPSVSPIWEIPLPIPPAFRES